MDRTEKIIRVNTLKELIKQKKLLLKKEQTELNLLQKKYEKENESELPILIFIIDESYPMPDDYTDCEYEYVYYCPDLDNIQCIMRHGYNELLPNTVDLRELFEEINMPKRIIPGSALSSEHCSKVDQAVLLLKRKIDELFDTHNINSWYELGTYLNSKIPERSQTKVLKPKE